MKCPECNEEMSWAGDQNIEENIIQFVFECNECQIEVIKTKEVIY